MSGLPRRVALLGPTASGKSSVAMALAEQLGDVELVSVDSMQVYRGMDIGTAKLPPAEREGVPHHVLDVWPVSHAASVAEYQRLARAAVADVRSRGRVPVLVGGSGLYVRAVLDDLRFPGTDRQLRAALEADADRLGAAAMHERLAAVDPDAAAVILPGNVRRIVRALEVVELTGQPFSGTLPPEGRHGQLLDAVLLGLQRPRPALRARIATRVERMWRDGLVDEVRALLASGLRDGPTASRAVGYSQVLALLAGRLDDAAARETTITATRRLAKRQETWFRRDPRVVWLDAAAPGLAEQALEAVAAHHWGPEE